VKLVHHITITAFAKPEEDAEKIKEGLLALIPFDLEREKVALDAQTALGFHEREITIFTLVLKKSAHCRTFIDSLLKHLDDEQKRQLLLQAESRLDENLDFFVRLKKDAWMNERNPVFTDTGYCYHIKFTLATYPKKRENALALLKTLFS